MSLTFALTALLMGLAGGPHCIAMCGAPSAAVIRIHDLSDQRAGAAARRGWLFHAGRVSGYAALGALAGSTVQGLAWLSTQSAALRPAWTLVHLGVLGWGLMLLVLARQPAWTQQAGHGLWLRVRPLAASARGVWTAGALWALMPCGLLYSALLVASLSGGALQGALSMALFGLTSGLSLAAGPWLWRRLQRLGGRGQATDFSTRAAGAVLAGAALWALWMDFTGRLAEWCAT